jgi:hypothetical protein
MHVSARTRVSPTVISGALISFQVLWCISLCVFGITNRGSKDGASAAPLWSIALLLLVPLSTLVLGPWLLRARRGDGQKLQVVDYCALVLGFAPVAFFGVLFVISFFVS